jgi:hypothetical protein
VYPIVVGRTVELRLPVDQSLGHFDGVRRLPILISRDLGVAAVLRQGGGVLRPHHVDREALGRQRKRDHGDIAADRDRPNLTVRGAGRILHAG